MKIISYKSNSMKKIILSAIIAITGITSYSQNVGAGKANLTDLTVTGGTAPAKFDSVRVTGNVNVTGKLSAGGVIIEKTLLGTTIKIDKINVGTDSLGMREICSHDSDLYIQSHAGLRNILFNTNNNGKMGIGTNNPQARLDVNGDVRIRSLSGTGFKYTTVVFDSTGKLINIPVITSGTFPPPCGVPCDPAFHSVNDCSKLGTLDQVGIGTYNPAAKLYVVNNPDCAGYDAFRIDGDIPSPNTLMIVRHNGNVGIGTINPNALFHVNGNAQLGTASNMTGQLAFYNQASANATILQAGNATSSVTYILPVADGSSGQFLTTNGSGTLAWQTAAGTGTIGGSGTLNYIAKFTPNGTSIGNSQIFDDGTNVGIGTATPQEKLHIATKVLINDVNNNKPDAPHNNYQLAVYGKIVATQLVSTDATLHWHDDEFKNETSFSDIEQEKEFTVKNSHLRNVPSEKEIKENGIEMGQMFSVQILKIEQLFKYSFLFNSQIKKLQDNNEKLLSENSLLKNELDALKKRIENLETKK